MNNGGTYCYCASGYSGPLCELQNDNCLSLPCQHGSECFNLVNNYTCNCTQYYTGYNCDIGNFLFPFTHSFHQLEFELVLNFRDTRSKWKFKKLDFLFDHNSLFNFSGSFVSVGSTIDSDYWASKIFFSNRQWKRIKKSSKRKRRIQKKKY